MTHSRSNPGTVLAAFLIGAITAAPLWLVIGWDGAHKSAERKAADKLEHACECWFRDRRCNEKDRIMACRMPREWRD